MQMFRAMNTDVTLAAPSLDPDTEHVLALEVAALFANTERRFSRFRADSELARLNQATAPIAVSRDLLEILGDARRHVMASDGMFDPAIGGALRACGYDRSFEPGALDREDRVASAPRARFSELVIDEAARVVQRPPHLQIDLGGFLKGRTVDRAAQLLPSLAMIDAGGDGVLRGAGPEGTGWLVDVEDPRDASRVLVTLRVRDRAVATSAPNRRCWRAGRALAHHLIDPRTGSPSISDLAQVTAVAPSAERADVTAKVAFLRGAAAATRWLAEQDGVGGVLVLRDGSLRVVGDVEVAEGSEVRDA